MNVIKEVKCIFWYTLTLTKQWTKLPRNKLSWLSLCWNQSIYWTSMSNILFWEEKKNTDLLRVSAFLHWTNVPAPWSAHIAPQLKSIAFFSNHRELERFLAFSRHPFIFSLARKSCFLSPSLCLEWNLCHLLSSFEETLLVWKTAVSFLASLFLLHSWTRKHFPPLTLLRTAAGSLSHWHLKRREWHCPGCRWAAIWHLRLSGFLGTSRLSPDSELKHVWLQLSPNCQASVLCGSEAFINHQHHHYH